MSKQSKQIEDIIQSALMGSQKPAEEATREILEAFITIPRKETCDGEVVERPGISAVAAGSGPEYAEAGIAANPNWLRNRAINLLNIADYIENRDAILEAKEAKAIAARGKRRDELAGELHVAGATWVHCTGPTRRAIDRIIELESAA